MDFLLNFLLQFSNRFWSGFFCPPYPLKIVPPLTLFVVLKDEVFIPFLFPLLLKPDQHYVANFHCCFLAEICHLFNAFLKKTSVSPHRHYHFLSNRLHTFFRKVSSQDFKLILHKFCKICYQLITVTCSIRDQHFQYN